MKKTYVKISFEFFKLDLCDVITFSETDSSFGDTIKWPGIEVK